MTTTTTILASVLVRGHGPDAACTLFAERRGFDMGVYGEFRIGQMGDESRERLEYHITPETGAWRDMVSRFAWFCLTLGPGAYELRGIGERLVGPWGSSVATADTDTTPPPWSEE